MRINTLKCDMPKCGAEFVAEKLHDFKEVRVGEARIRVHIEGFDKQDARIDLCPACQLKVLGMLVPKSPIAAAVVIEPKPAEDD